MKLLLLSCVAMAALAQTVPVAQYQVSGIVVDHLTNRPLNHVLVELTRAGKGNGDASVLTTEDGHFLFLHVPLGKYSLTAEKRGQSPQSFHADGQYGTAVVVDGRQKTDGLVFALRTDASITGMVVGDDGEPVSNAQIHLFKESVTDGEARTVHAGGANTNSQGEFHFGHLDAGNYYAAAIAMPWFAQAGGQMESNARVTYPVTFYGDTTDAARSRVITLAEGNAASLQINLHTVPSIRVKLSDPARGASLFAPGPGNSQVPVNVGTDTKGTELINLAAGRYEVMEYRQGPPIPHWVDLEDGGSLSFDKAPSGDITGRLIVVDGPKPSGDFEIFLGGGNRTFSCQVAADGTFKFEKVVAGSYPVHQGSPEILISSFTAQGARIVGDKLEMPSGSAVNLTIKAVTRKNLVTLEGIAVTNGAASAGAMVLLLPQDLDHMRLVRRDQSDADGSFSLRDVIPGRYTLVALDDGKNLAYKNAALIKPYVVGGVPVTVPSTSSDSIKVPVQVRKR